MTSTYQYMYATDWENQQNDPQVFPGKASDEILKKYPPTVIWTSEFDFLRRDNEQFAARLKKVGKLAEISIMPARTHAYMSLADGAKELYLFDLEERLAFDHLVTN